MKVEKMFFVENVFRLLLLFENAFLFIPEFWEKLMLVLVFEKDEIRKIAKM